MNSDRNESGQHSQNWIAEYILILIGLSGLFYFLFGNTFQAYFSILEEHHIVNDSSKTIWEWMGIIINDTKQFGRFRPAYYLFHFAKIWLFGLNPYVLHIVTTGLGVLTCFFFYITMRKVCADVLSSLFFILLFAVTGYQNMIWYQIFSAAETLGMAFTSISVWTVVKAASQGKLSLWDLLALITMALAGITKESFVLIIPALLLLRLMLHCWFSQETWVQALRRLHLPLVVGLLIFIVEILILVVILLFMPKSYSANAAGLSLTSFDPRVWYRLLASSEMVAIAQYLPVGALILAIYCYWPGHRASRPYLLVGSLTGVAWLIPQLVLYHQGLVDRYFFPAIIALTAVVGLSLAVLWQRRTWLTRLVWFAYVLWLLPTLSAGITKTTYAASRYTAETLTSHEIVTYIAQKVPASQAIIIVADPGTSYGFEATYALPIYLKVAGSGSPVYLLPLTSQGERSSIHIPFAEHITARLSYPQILSLADIGGIIMFANFIDSLPILPSWFVCSPWQEIIFAKPYQAFSLQKLGHVKVGEISYRILIPGIPPAEFPANSPLITIAPSLKGKVGINPWVKTPWWGIEHVESSAVLWLGHGDEQGLQGSLWSAEQQPVRIAIDFVPGPARTDRGRTVELTLVNQAGVHTERHKGDQRGQIIFEAKLQPGCNEFSFKVLDEVTIFQQPNGDIRPLLIYLRHVTVSHIFDQSQARLTDAPLVNIDSSLVGVIKEDLQLQTPPWGVETYNGTSILWLGTGESEGLYGTIWSDEKRTIRAIFAVTPGPAREDLQRTVELTVQNQVGVQKVRQQFTQATELIFTSELQSGRNDFQFTVLDEATILKQPNGDTRPLVVLLRQINIMPY